MNKTKSMSSGAGFFPKGGANKMAPQQGAHAVRPGVTSTSGAGKGPKFPSGGKTKMFGKRSAAPARPC